MNQIQRPAPSSPAHPHSLAPASVFDALDCESSGLDPREAELRLQAYGPNRLPEARPESLFRRFLKHFNDVLIHVLLGAAGLTALLGYWIDTAVIMAVVLVNAGIGFIQEGKAEKALAGLRSMLSSRAEVCRNGSWQEVPAQDLVPGDVIRLRSGGRVPADARLFEANNLRIEESALTGESAPTEKDCEPVAANAGIGDRRGMVFSGTLVTSGRGTAVVTATGARTEIGLINRLISDVQTLQTPLTRQMAAFSKVLSGIIVALAALMAAVGWLHDFPPADLLLAAIGFAVAAIPEGLPAILTITLALGVQRMARRNAITRRLDAVETLGAVTVICSDKTGTLTRNEMTVRHIVTAAHQFDIDGVGYSPQGSISLDKAPAPIDQHPDLAQLVEIFAVANDSRIEQESGGWVVRGEPTEGALLALASKAGFSVGGYRRLAAVPFESVNKFMATLHELPGTGRRILMKGAPDRLLERCSTQLGPDGDAEPLAREFWNRQIDALGSQGLRVLAAAYRDAPEQDRLSPDDLGSGLTFAGLVGIIDPPRAEAITAIEACHRAGIRVKMITGDHAGTALAIAREMGIGAGRPPRAITGQDIEQASDAALRELAQSCDVFARTSPEHKLRLVTALQAAEEVVAMTGDGVNDAPALKRADVGIAMGIKGTEATKEAADIVLADDNFHSIALAIEEGRTIYDNLRKAILFILPTNGAQGLVVLAAVLLGMVLPLTPVQILWVNMVVAVTLALALAFEPADPGLMIRPPRPAGSPIVSGAFLWRVGLVSVLIGGSTILVFQQALSSGASLEAARSLAVNTLVVAQAFYLFNSRFLLATGLNLKLLFSNAKAWLAVGVLAMLQLGFIYLPLMNRLFDTVPLAASEWLVPLGMGACVFILIEVEKGLVRKFARP